MTTLRPHPVGIPTPVPSTVSQPFWDGCRRGELLFQRCERGHVVFNPAARCRLCLSDHLSWEQSKGTGSVYSWSIVWRPQTPAFRVPYAAAIVTLDEGFQMIANIIGCEPEQIHADLRVHVEFHPVGDNVFLPYFRPETSP